MKIIKIETLDKGQFKVKVDTHQDALDFMEMQINANPCPYGIPEHEIKLLSSDESPENSISVRETVENIKIEIDGNITTSNVHYKIYTIPADFTYTIEDAGVDIIRDRIDNILCKTDWLFVSDLEYSPEHKEVYKQYREYLRALESVNLEEFEQYVEINHSELVDKEKAISRFNYYL